MVVDEDLLRRKGAQGCVTCPWAAELSLVYQPELNFVWYNTCLYPNVSFFAVRVLLSGLEVEEGQQIEKLAVPHV